MSDTKVGQYVDENFYTSHKNLMYAARNFSIEHLHYDELSFQNIQPVYGK